MIKSGCKQRLHDTAKSATLVKSPLCLQLSLTDQDKKRDKIRKCTYAPIPAQGVRSVPGFLCLYLLKMHLGPLYHGLTFTFSDWVDSLLKLIHMKLWSFQCTLGTCLAPNRTTRYFNQSSFCKYLIYALGSIINLHEQDRQETKKKEYFNTRPWQVDFSLWPTCAVGQVKFSQLLNHAFVWAHWLAFWTS